jgi:hypothetical protein
VNLTRPCVRPGWWLPLLTLPLLWPVSTTRAQIPFLDPLPWSAAADTLGQRALEVSWDRFDDERVHWSADRVGLTGLLAMGERAHLFLRMHFLTLDTADRPALVRWPALRGEQADPGWPHEAQVDGFGRPEIGVIGLLRLPLLGPGRYALALGLPSGRDQLYPLSAASMPLRLAWRRDLGGGSPWQLSLAVEVLQHLDSAHEFLEPAAFPSGVIYSAALGWGHGSHRRLELGWRESRLEGRRSALLGLQGWLPWGERNACGIAVQRELAGSANRPFGTQFSIAWRLISAPAQGQGAERDRP